MSETSGNLWSGLPTKEIEPKTLTYTERELLKTLWRFRDRVPGAPWLLWRGATATLLLLPLMLVPAGLVAFLAAFAMNGVDESGGDAVRIALAIGVATWLGLVFGFVVRDQIEVRMTIAAWPMLNRILLFHEIERRLQEAKVSKSGDDVERRP